ncbi:Ornithine aminotransferase 2 [Jeotgalicoccus aerolatus]|uniref:Ornithine aminotransferase n=2 Tax=Jeotgalicoccus aerolatus TaxID=709510 RepID=A0A1G8ZTB6_9STAP|nr:ornithine--oxo-acid transaminase [Jeotgalicoccus aerolatus]MBP1951237.1 ornithine--oxo-acid transaminase [Jeotgalicoccus aerolatus]NMA81238.1 ornithine--oxo-acid transaminase [Jeotgalicoccus aerolatus]CAD2077512.1 Ornithine aminotransferase 2 [Jeotgalicoccus aerolatus]SDK18369.1 ornithine--oxo-acid transaminase [Jeotgalicoccus aerolatus]GGD99103.1 ornithine aminotransferase [Jeotgalicoccus aerolatus]
MRSEEIINQTEQHDTDIYKPLPIVISEAEGVWVKDPEGNKYMDMLSAYSAVNQGHRHPKIIQALKDQADKVTLTSRSFHVDCLGDWYDKLSELSGKNRVLPMNTGAEAVESAIKVARRWAYEVKGVADNQAEVIAMKNNFHGRTLIPMSMSSEAEYRRGFGPMGDGFQIVDYGDPDALEDAINDNTAAVILEPIQGEAGVNIPPKGYLKQVREICDRNNVLFISDEIQAGLGRSGKMFATDWDDVVPDMYILGKALGGGVFPVSVVLGDDEVMRVLNEGSHGSTFGGNPLAAKVSEAALDVIIDEKLSERSLELGEYLLSELKKIKNDAIVDLRGRGLFIGLELNKSARKFCEELKDEGVLCKETHGTVVRFAPPLIVTKEEIDWALERVKKVFDKGTF